MEMEQSQRAKQACGMKGAIFHLEKIYTQIRTKQVSVKESIVDVKGFIDILESHNETWLFSQLCKAHLYIVMGKYQIPVIAPEDMEGEETQPDLSYEYAKRILKQIQYEMKKAPVKYQAYYWYLTSLYNEDPTYSLSIGKQIKKLYQKHRESWEVAWFYLHMATIVYENPVKKQEIMEYQLREGCISPHMYIEAITLWNQYPALITKLESWQYNSLYYGVKYNLLSEELCMKIAYLAERGNVGHKVVMKILQKSYQNTNNLEILSAICSLSIKTNRWNQDDFYWYQLGIEKELKITGLYEYYMMTLDRTQKVEIPKPVLLYFMYQNNLPYEQLAYLYAYLLWTKESGKDAKNTLQTTDSSISPFQASEIIELKYEQIVAFLIQQIQQERINPDLKYLYYKIILEQKLISGIADKLVTLLFTQSIEIGDDIKSMILLQDKTQEEMVYQVHKGMVNVTLYRPVNSLFLEDDKGNRTTMVYRYGKEEYEDLEKRVDQFLRLLLVENRHTKAYDCMRLYGSENINPSIVLGILTRMIELEEEIERDSFTDEVIRLVKAKCYNEVTLQYLVEWFHDTLEEMQYVWKVAHEFELETYPIAGRILSRVIQEETQVAEEKEIIRDFVNNVGSTEVIQNYITYKGYGYLREEAEMDSFAVAQIPKMSSDLIGELSFLKYYAFHPEERTEGVERILLSYLAHVIQKEGIFFPFFQAYEELYGGVENKIEETAIVYHGHKESLVTLYYRMIRNHQVATPFLREELKQMAADIYIKYLPVYGDERVEYYIIENTNEQEYVTQLTVAESAPMSLKKGRFAQIQGIITKNQEEEYEEAHDLLKAYLQELYLTETIFQPTNDFC